MIKKMISAAALSLSVCAYAMAQTQTQPQQQQNQPGVQTQPNQPDIQNQPNQVPQPAEAPQPPIPPAGDVHDGHNHDGHNHSGKPTIHERQENQQNRIDEGVKSGKLTPEEAERLEKRMHETQHSKKAAKADGNMTDKERMEIRKEQKKTGKAIHRQKHDDQKMNYAKPADGTSTPQ